MYYFKLALKNVFSRKSSYLIIAFISFAIMLLVVVNAIFDGTDNGIRTVFKESFTGDIVIREKTKSNTSLFGNVSIIDESVTPTKELSDFTKICSYLDEIPEIKAYTPQISTVSIIEVEERKASSAVFAVNAADYVKMMNAIQITQGSVFQKGEKGILLSEKWVESFYQNNKIHLNLGDTVQLVYSDGNTFRIRAVPITGIFKYPVEQKILDKVVLCDPDTVRSLLGRETVYSQEIQIDNEAQEIFESIDEDFDSLFDEVSDFQTDEAESSEDFSDIDFLEDSDAVSSEVSTTVGENTSWDFIVIKLNENANERHVIKMLNRIAQNNGYSFEAINWRSAAGISAQYIFYLRIILIAGIVVILLSGLIVVNNTLIINIVERTREIGTMRAIGANKRNISALCMKETLILTITSGFVGCILATLVIFIMQKFPIALTNPFFVQLFGSEFIFPQYQVKNYLSGIVLSVVLGLVSWIFPVFEALKIMPVVAMKGGK